MVCLNIFGTKITPPWFHMNYECIFKQKITMQKYLNLLSPFCLRSIPGSPDVVCVSYMSLQINVHSVCNLCNECVLPIISISICILIVITRSCVLRMFFDIHKQLGSSG